jgi:WD40 repeat protein
MGDRPVTNLAFDPTGTRLAVGSLDADLTMYDVTTGQILHGPVRLPASLGLLVWSADGRRLHTGGSDGVLRTFDTETWEPKGDMALDPSQQALRLGTLSSDGSTLVVPAQSGQVFLVDERTGQLRGRPLISDGTSIQRAVLTDDGRTVAAVGSDGSLRLFDVETGRTIGPRLTGHTGEALALELAPVGHLASGGLFDDLVIQWDLDPGAWLKRACALVGRDLTAQEWSDYVGGTYRPTCTNLPTSD